MKPKIPIEVWKTPPDPVDGLLGDPEPPRASASPARETSVRESAPVEPRQANATPRPRPAPQTTESRPENTAKVHVTLYLDPEDIDRLRTEQLRRQQELKRPKRGVTDASAVVRDLIRTHLR